MTFASQWTPARTPIGQWAIPGAKKGFPDMKHSMPTGTISEQQDAPLAARIYKDGALVEQADVYQVLVRVHDELGVEVYGSEDEPADVIFDTLQGTTGAPDASWTADVTGYNLKVTIPGRGVFLAGGRRYHAEVVVELLDGDNVTLTGSLQVEPGRTFKKSQAR